MRLIPRRLEWNCRNTLSLNVKGITTLSAIIKQESTTDKEDRRRYKSKSYLSSKHFGHFDFANWIALLRTVSLAVSWRTSSAVSGVLRTEFESTRHTSFSTVILEMSISSSDEHWFFDDAKQPISLAEIGGFATLDFEVVAQRHYCLALKTICRVYGNTFSSYDSDLSWVTLFLGAPSSRRTPTYFLWKNPFQANFINSGSWALKQLIRMWSRL